MIKPEFFDSDSLAECSVPARLAFIGLMVYADDNGNLKLSIGRLRSNIYDDEYTDDEFLAMLAELEAVDCIRLYKVGDKAYITITNFGVYQTINRPSKTTIPQPNIHAQTHVLRGCLTGSMNDSLNDSR